MISTRTFQEVCIKSLLEVIRGVQNDLLEGPGTFSLVFSLQVLVLHGGLGDGTWGLNDLEHIKRPMQDRFTISGSKSMSSAQIRK